MDGAGERHRQPVLADYEHYLHQSGRSTATIRAYIHDVATFLRWFEHSCGPFEPRAVSVSTIRRYHQEVLSQGHSLATVNQHMVALSRFFRWARQQGIVDSTPFLLLDAIVARQPVTAPHWLTRAEQEALLAAVRRGGSVRDRAILQTLLGTGIRLSEIAHLQIADMHVAEGKSYLRIHAGQGSKVREIPLDGATQAALSEYLEWRKGEPGDHLFVGQRGDLNQRGVDYLVHKYAHQAELPDVTAHTLRHTFARNQVEAGTPLDVLARLLGHEHLDSVRMYTLEQRASTGPPQRGAGDPPDEKKGSAA